jgi:hypothetical protein
MDRVDLAQQRLALMKSVDEESALTQLAMAWVHMRAVRCLPPFDHSSSMNCTVFVVQGDPKGLVDASNIYEDLSEKYGASVMLTTGLAVSKMHQGLWEEAETHLQQALTKVSLLPTLALYLLPWIGFLESRQFGEHDHSLLSSRQIS